MMRSSTLTLAVLAVLCSLWAPQVHTANTNVHIAFLTDCTVYSDWQVRLFGLLIVKARNF